MDEVPPFEALQHLARRQAAGELLLAGTVATTRVAGSGAVARRLEHGHALGVGPVQVLEDDAGPGGRRCAPAMASTTAPPDVVGRPAAGRRARRAPPRRAARASPARPRRPARRRAAGRPPMSSWTQAGLADAGLAGDEGDGGQAVGLGARRSRPVRRFERRGPPDHDGAQTGPGRQHAAERTGGSGRALGAWPSGGRPALVGAGRNGSGTGRVGHRGAGSGRRARRAGARGGGARRSLHVGDVVLGDGDVLVRVHAARMRS